MHERRYTRDHIWVCLAGELATVGITDHAQSELGAVTYVTVKKKGSAVAQGGTLGVIESVKTASELVAPIAGRILRINPLVVKTPARINSDPLGEGWICELEPDDPAQVDALLDEAAYRLLVG